MFGDVAIVAPQRESVTITPFCVAIHRGDAGDAMCQRQ